MRISDEEILAKLLEYQPDLHDTRRFEFIWVIKKMMEKQGFALDIGCDGSILDKYINENLDFTMVGVDIDPSGYTYYDGSPRTKFCLHDCRESLPDSWKGIFSIITIVSTLEHMSAKDASKILENAIACLEKDGGILVTLPHGSGPAMQGRWPVLCYNEKNISQIAKLADLKVASWEISGKKLKSNLPIICIELMKK